MATYSDNFNRSDTGANAGWGANWTHSPANTGFEVLSNQGRTVSNFTERLARYTGGASANNQFSKATVASLSGDGYAYVAVRAADLSNCYVGGFLSSNQVRLTKIVSGVGTNLGTTSVTFSTNDTIEIRADGTSISLYVNDGLQIGPITDTDLSSGSPGIYTLNSNTFDDWSGGDLTAPTVKKLKLLAHSSAASASAITGVVFAVPSGSDITGAKIGEFTGASFLGSGSNESGQAVLKVALTEFTTAGALTTSDTPVALVRNASNTTGIVSCTVIEE